MTSSSTRPLFGSVSPPRQSQKKSQKKGDGGEKKPLIAHLTAFKGFTSLPPLKVKVCGSSDSRGQAAIGPSTKTARVPKQSGACWSLAALPRQRDTMKLYLFLLSTPTSPPTHPRPLLLSTIKEEVSPAGSRPLQSLTKSKSPTVTSSQEHQFDVSPVRNPVNYVARARTYFYFISHRRQMIFTYLLI